MGLVGHDAVNLVQHARVIGDDDECGRFLSRWLLGTCQRSYDVSDSVFFVAVLQRSQLFELHWVDHHGKLVVVRYQYGLVAGGSDALHRERREEYPEK